MILAALSLASVFATPILPLADAYALRGLGERRRAYGPVRLWGSVSFIVANLAGGVMLQLAGAGNLIWVLVAAQALTASVALLLVPQPPRAGPVTEAARRRSLWRVPIFVAVVISASLIQASHAVLMGFATLQWSARGLDGPAIGILWSLGVVAEIVLFAVSGRVVVAVGALPMIVFGGLAAVVRWAAMAGDPPGALLPVLQCLHALSYGATHLGTMAFLARFASPSRGATAQGDYVAFQSIIFAAAMGLSGLLVEASAGLAYVAMAATAAVGTAIAIAAQQREPAADRP
jgi:PPP family 3-phenylpropionic acid transporter